jgi:ParB-like chromosome segregation protein Spo0J
MSDPSIVHGCDVPIVKLVPRTQREVGKKDYQRLKASLQATGLLEPLVVFDQCDDFLILDGQHRYDILMEMGVENVPCIVWKEREAYTANRMVNHLSAAEEMRMLRKSLEELDEQTIADALALSGIKHRLNDGLLKHLDPKVVEAFEGGKLSRPTAKELTHVKPERQVEIVDLMTTCNDYSSTFAKGLVLKTPPNRRAKTNGAKTPWTQADEKKNDLLKQLRQAEQQQDFFSGLYRQYAANLLKLASYVRLLIANQRVREYLQEHFINELEQFDQIVASTER